MNIHSHYLTIALSMCILLHCRLVEKVVRAFSANHNKLKQSELKMTAFT